MRHLGSYEKGKDSGRNELDDALDDLPREVVKQLEESLRALAERPASISEVSGALSSGR